jgi:predicted ATP-grasp superfamily ATP-dependent carboligase
VTLIDGMSRRIDWPETVFYHARPEGSDRDVVLLLGVEPNYRWRTFAELVSALAQQLSVELTITMGSLLADVPHTRPAPVTGSANDPVLVEQLGLSASRYEGPTGIVGVLHDACSRDGLPSASLWAAVPHYVQLTPSPRAAKALVERLGTLLGLTIDVAELDAASDSYAQQVSDAVAVDPETQAYVEELEQRVDELEDDDAQLPSGDALAAELTRYLREREQRDDDDGDDVARRQ